MGIFSRWFGPSGGGALPNLTSGTEEGWCDCSFRVENQRRSPSDKQLLRAEAMHQGARVAVDVVLDREWEKVCLSEDPPIWGWRGIVRLQRSGTDSDALVQSLDALYDVGTGVSRMASEVTFTAISLEGNPGRLQEGRLKLKLFYEPESATEDEAGERYAEVYLNIDLSASRLELAEKDQDYRLPLLQALAHPGESAAP
jgi:hypothetical protein